LRDRAYSEKSDVWAYGVTLWEVVTAKEPFAGMDILQVAMKVRDEALTLETYIPDECPSYLRKLMGLCWQQNPADRPTFVGIVEWLLLNAPKADREMLNEEDGFAVSSAVATPQTEQVPSKSKDKRKTNTPVSTQYDELNV
jgi:serine/threonine protein kinase